MSEHPPEPPPKERRRAKILSEKIEHRPGSSDQGANSAENPYWEDPPPHPNPELGCIRRGICCRSSPGWFGPGEVEKAAQFLEMEPDAFVRKYVVVDQVEVDGQVVHAFAPVKLDQFGAPQVQPGTKVDGTYRYFRGACIFYDGQGCRIYGARPVECRAYVCTQLPEENLSHEEIGRMWLNGEVWEKPRSMTPKGLQPPES